MYWCIHTSEQCTYTAVRVKRVTSCLDFYANYSPIRPEPLAISYTYATGCKWVSENNSSRHLGEVAIHLLSGRLNTPSALCLTKTAKAAAQQKEVAPAVQANSPRPQRGAGLSAVSKPLGNPRQRGPHMRGTCAPKGESQEPTTGGTISIVAASGLRTRNREVRARQEIPKERLRANPGP